MLRQIPWFSPAGLQQMHVAEMPVEVNQVFFFNDLYYMQKKICSKVREVEQLLKAHAKCANTAKNASNTLVLVILCYGNLIQL